MISELESASPRSYNYSSDTEARIGGLVDLTYVGRKGSREFLELAKLWSNLYLILLVQQHRQQSLCPAGILNCLGCEEEIFGSFEIKAAILWCLAGFLAGWVLEQEDHSIDGAVRPLD